MFQPQYLYNKYSALGLRIALLIVYLALSYSQLYFKTTLPLYVDAIFFLLFLDYKNILNLKNYYCVYAFLIFKLSSQFWFPNDYKLTFDGTLFVIAFLLGYEIKNALAVTHIPKKTADAVNYEKYTVTLELLIKIFVVLKIIYLIFLISQYGVSSFYSGQMLADKISNYGRKSVMDSILTIYTAFIDNFLLAIIVLYVKYISAQGKTPNYYYLILALLVMPLIILSRANFAFNLITLLAIYAYFSKSMVKVYTYLIPGLIILFAISAYIGFLRINSYQTEDIADVTSGDQFFTELTPIIAYNDVKENINVLHYQYGKTIFLPLILKPIPRGLWPEKPNNSGAMYMKEFNADSFAAGFAIPVMIFGDLFLNFGIYVTILLLLLFGVLIGKCNQIYTNKQYTNIDNYLILFVCFYSVLRNCLPEALISILLIFLSKKIIQIFILKVPIRNT
ncbi:MAG: O-antigen polymerase [Bacteroidota bacterium]